MTEYQNFMLQVCSGCTVGFLIGIWGCNIAFFIKDRKEKRAQKKREAEFQKEASKEQE